MSNSTLSASSFCCDRRRCPGLKLVEIGLVSIVSASPDKNLLAPVQFAFLIESE